MLGAVALALAAAHAGGGKAVAPADAHVAGELKPGRRLFLQVHEIIVVEDGGDIHPLGAGHTVAAAGAAHLLPRPQNGPDAAHQGPVRLRQTAGAGGVRDAAVLLHHFLAVHAGENAGDAALVPQPPQAQLGGGIAGAAIRECFAGLLAQPHQLAAPEGLHDDHRDALGLGGLQTGPARLGVLVQIIVLNLAEIPVVGVQNLQKGIGAAVVGKADLPDAALGFAGGNPVLDAQGFQVFPLGIIGEHVHEVIVDMVGAEALQLLPEGLVDGLLAAHHVLGQLGGDVHTVPDAVFLQNAAQALLAAGVDVGGVEIVDAPVNGQQHLAGSLVIVDGGALFGKAHTAEAQLGDGVAVAVGTVLHGMTLLLGRRFFYTILLSASRRKPYCISRNCLHIFTQNCLHSVHRKISTLPLTVLILVVYYVLNKRNGR